MVSALGRASGATGFGIRLFGLGFRCRLEALAFWATALCCVRFVFVAEGTELM